MEKYYICSAGESFDSIAYYLYGDSKYASQLIENNFGYCHIQRFAGGEMLLINEYIRDNSLPPWKRG